MRFSRPTAALTALALCLTAAAAAAASPPRRDPASASLHAPLSVRQTFTCNTGQQSGPFCCAADCPQCGGVGCGSTGRGDACCTGRITASARICGTHPPPCLISASAPPAPSSAPDPACATGVALGNVCCPAACGFCGGAGCGSRGPGGGQCCYGKTRDSGVLCTTAGPPCLIVATPTPSPSRTPMPLPRGPTGTPGQWTNIDAQLTGRPQARHEACFLMVNGKGYLLGGRGERVVSILDPVAKTWTAGPAMVRMMHHMQCVSVGTKIYIAAAWEGRFPSETNLEDMHVFDTATLTWSTLPALPEGRRRGSAGVAVLDNKIYVLTGNTGGHGTGSATVGYADYYDLATGAWVTGTLPNMPEPRDHTTATVVDGEICVAAGRDGAQADFFAATRASTYCLNVTTRSWRKAADIPTQRAGHAAGLTCDGRMMIVGGEGPSFAFKETELFDGQAWANGPRLVRQRHGSGLAVAKCPCGHVFIASGSGNRGGSPELTSTELYVPPGGATSCTSY